MSTIDTGSQAISVGSDTSNIHGIPDTSIHDNSKRATSLSSVLLFMAVCFWVAACCLGLWRTFGPSRWGFVPDAVVTTVDFGNVSPGSKGHGTFRITNVGWAAGKIGQVSSSCGCLATSVPQDTIPPGEETPLAFEVTFDHQLGKTRKTLIVTSENTGKQLVLNIIADVQATSADPARSPKQKQ